MATPTEQEVAAIEAKLIALIAAKEAAPLGSLTDVQREQVRELWRLEEHRAEELSVRLRYWAGHAKAYTKKEIKEIGMNEYRVHAKGLRNQIEELAKTSRADAEKKTNDERVRHLETPERTVERLNENYVHVLAGSATFVLRRYDGALIKPSAFKEQHVEPVQHVNGRGELVQRPAGEVWLDSPNRSLARHGLIFDPAKAPGLVDTEQGADYRAYNTWTGFAMQDQQGDWSMANDVILHGLAEGNQLWADDILNWCAYRVQHPERAMETALVLAGPHGAGKSSLGLCLQKWFGPKHSMAPPTSKAVTGDFNQHLMDLCVLICEEAFFVGDAKAFQILKALITSGTISIHVKYGGRFTVQSRLGLLLLTNQTHAIHATFGDRRYRAFGAAEWHQNDEMYWSAYYNQMDRGGYGAMLYDLKRRNISNWNPRVPLVTDALVQQRSLTRRHTLAGWWETLLRRGFIFNSVHAKNIVTFCEWPDFASTELLLESFRQWASEQRLSRHEMVTDKQMGEFMTRELKLLACRPRGLSLAGEDRMGEIKRRERASGYRLLDLNDARVKFDQQHGEINDWEPGHPGHEPQNDVDEHPVTDGFFDDNQEPSNE